MALQVCLEMRYMLLPFPTKQLCEMTRFMVLGGS